MKIFGIKISSRLIILILIMVGLYSFLFIKFKSPYSLKFILNKSLDSELGIKTYIIKSDFQKHQNIVKILVPDDMDREKKYPVLYILPVNPGIWDNFWINGIRKAALKDIHNKYQLICVYPRYEHMPWFGDHPENSGIQQESHLLYSVIPYVDNNFSTIQEPQGRMLIGFSKSGWAAYALLLRNPRLFGKAASWDAPLMFDDIYQWATGLKEVFGDEENFQKYFLPDLFIKQADSLRFKSPRFVLMGYALIKDHTEQMHQFLNEYDIPHIYDLREGGRHAWDSGWFEEAVKFLVEKREE